ncbi:aldehyde dehydrogenase family protein [Foetidibacter luteolus]|uniref:aldehyde dehydrogenase family protein n=1 Tax=Foetidibacter luteolus TaxID=2608880 RepID=UPI00129A2D00|nr:aldehyde dehydrogenase family protein [Foetidibacter luteolus]
MKKKIGISYSEMLFENYVNWFTAQDLADDIEITVLSYEKNNVQDIYSCDGFVLTGGVDVHPSYYNGSADYVNRPSAFSLQRDRFEENIYRYSQLQQLPVLGICRGMQLVNVLEGGKLVQDLGNGNSQHKKDVIDKQHKVAAVKETFLHTVTGAVDGAVNSAHHQAVHPQAIAPGLLPNVYAADDKTIEGFEFADKTGKGFMLCVQWHPERMIEKEQNPFSQHIKNQFLSAVRNTNMKKLQVVNPATEEIITELTQDSKESLEQKLATLRNHHAKWGAVALAERVKIIQRFSELLEEHKEHLAAVLTSEVGKPLQQSRNEVNGARARIKWLAGNAEKYLSDEVMVEEPGLTEKISYEPLGVICNISAWNYPYLVGTNVFIPALLAGNSVMYKPSEYAVLTGLEIEKLLKQAGVPETAFQVAVGAGAVGEVLLDLPFDGYFFTGSYKTGKYIYERVAPKMVPCQCELGGKDPLYVADDIEDIKGVAAATADGAFYNNGQSCCSVERIYVHEKVYDSYVDEFVKEVASWKKGLPTESGVYIGPLTRKEQLNVLDNQINDAVGKGGKVLAGGKQIPGKGYYFEPTVVVNASHDMLLMKDESFGPVIGIMKVNSDEEAVKLMQDTEYGLTASVYTASRNRAETILGKVDSGTGYWNCCDCVSAALPWSGRKHSGFGSTLSHAGLRGFTRPKAYHLRG